MSESELEGGDFMCWRCELLLESMIRNCEYSRDCSGHMIYTVTTVLVRIGFVFNVTAGVFRPMFEQSSRGIWADWERLGGVRWSIALTILIVLPYYQVY
jgi:hypothetical protein